MNEWIELIQQTTFYKWAYFENRHLSFHLLAGALGGGMFVWMKYLYSQLVPMEDYDIELWDSWTAAKIHEYRYFICLFVAIGWEVLEYHTGIGAYPTKEQFYYDATGDLLGEMLTATLVMR